ncbi:MAG: ABC transporter ATP-binding protein [Alphaproteobacteria bacterium]|nr:ABC transporter ATP-binding protein [Alphaproteobacteria bacterium]
MSKKNNHEQYWICIKSVFFATFQDKKIFASFCMAVVFLLIGIISNILVPFILKNTVEFFAVHHDSSMTTLILISYGLIWIISQASLSLRSICTYRIEQRIIYTLGIKILSHLHSLSQNYFLNQKAGALTNLIRRAQQDVPEVTLGIFFHVLPTIIEFLFVIILVSIIYPPIYGFFLASTLIVFFGYTFISMKSILTSRHIANEIDKKADGIVTDWLLNYEAIKVFNKQEYAIKTYQQQLKEREKAEVNFMTNLSLVRLIQSVILGIGLSFLTYYVGKGVLEGKLTVGDFVLFNGYILQFIIPISILGQLAQDMKKALLDMKGILDILLTEPEIKQNKFPITFNETNFELEFKRVFFKYQDRPILNNISFKISSGETLLIIGETGTGKSTIAKLLLRLYEPTSGQILINQIDTKLLSFESLYETIGWVPQETYLLNDTLYNNLLFVKQDACLDEIEFVLEKANLLSFVKNLPNKLYTNLGDRGAKLSGGEKQRLALARLFLKKPKICIFDEPTSFLDSKTESIIQANIEKYLPNMTKIIITHKPFMVSSANQIISLHPKKLTKERKIIFQENNINNIFKQTTNTFIGEKNESYQ